MENQKMKNRKNENRTIPKIRRTKKQKNALNIEKTKIQQKIKKKRNKSK